jgi:hypothetical protein
LDKLEYLNAIRSPIGRHWSQYRKMGWFKF